MQTSQKKPKSEDSEKLELRLKLLIEHGINLRDRIITLTGEIDDDTFHVVDTAMAELEAESKKAVTIRINSIGGSVYDAMGIVGRLKSSKVSKIITEGYGCVMSAATLILASGTERKISEYSWFMHHESQLMELGSMSASQLNAYNRHLQREEDVWATWMAQFSKKSKAFWRKSGTNKESYFSPDELL